MAKIARTNTNPGLTLCRVSGLNRFAGLITHGAILINAFSDDMESYPLIFYIVIPNVKGWDLISNVALMDWTVL